MSDDRYPYDEWVNLALQGVLRRALRTLSTQGFTGEHHLFISFDTNHTDVRMPGFLRAQYPDEITIVLQHQFEDLLVDEDVFQVSLRAIAYQTIAATLIPALAALWPVMALI